MGLEKDQPKFKAIITRPDMVVNEKQKITDRIITFVAPHIDVRVLATVLVDLAIHGGKQQFYTNDELKVNGRKLLGK